MAEKQERRVLVGLRLEESALRQVKAIVKVDMDAAAVRAYVLKGLESKAVK